MVQKLCLYRIIMYGYVLCIFVYCIIFSMDRIVVQKKDLDRFGGSVGLVRKMQEIFFVHGDWLCVVLCVWTFYHVCLIMLRCTAWTLKDSCGVISIDSVWPGVEQYPNIPSMARGMASKMTPVWQAEWHSGLVPWWFWHLASTLGLQLCHALPHKTSWCQHGVNLCFPSPRVCIFDSTKALKLKVHWTPCSVSFGLSANIKCSSMTCLWN